MTAQTFTRTRIAPTPSGYLHIGNVLSFVITATLAEKYGARILLRIDDLDQQRVNREYVEDIFDTLNFLEIPWHEGPRNYEEYKNEWSQLHRIDLYNRQLDALKDNGHLFACTCSRSQIRALSRDESYPGTCRNKGLAFDTPDCSWRLRTDGAENVTVHPITGLDIITTLPGDVRDFIVRKKDGFPAYQLASVADDLHFGVDLIVRGQDLWSSTLAQLYLAKKMRADAFLNTMFHHHGLITNPSGTKLSKSAGDTSIQALRKQGNNAEQIFILIGKSLGLNEPISNWQTLGKLII